MKDFLISPPFGNYIGHRSASSVLGTFTLYRRPGRFGQICQFVLDNIRHPVEDGWRNRIGLRNPGVGALNGMRSDYIYSFAGLDQREWIGLMHWLLNATVSHHRPTIELNLGCRNVHNGTTDIPVYVLNRLCLLFTVIAKLPADPDLAMRLAERCAESGVDYFHCGNTVLDNPGSLSGYPAKRVNLAICEEIAKRYPQIPVIGGGGIYRFEDLLDYQNAGAVKFSLATIWLRPWRALSIIRQYEAHNALRDTAEPKARELYADGVP